MESIVTTSRHHGMGPFTISSPTMKSMQTKAPTYTGPDVPGCSPQYCPSCWYMGLYSCLASFIAVSLRLRGTEAPPLALGMSSVHVSPMP